MSLQTGDTLRNNEVAQVEATIGAAPHLHMRTGAKPVNCAAADSGTLLANITLPSDWLTAPGTPGAGQVTKSGTWQDLSADASGTVGHFRIMDSAETVCHAQGEVTATGGGGVITVDNVVFAAGQAFTVNTFVWTIPDGV